MAQPTDHDAPDDRPLGDGLPAVEHDYWPPEDVFSYPGSKPPKENPIKYFAHEPFCSPGRFVLDVLTLFAYVAFGYCLLARYSWVPSLTQPLVVALVLLCAIPCCRFGWSLARRTSPDEVGHPRDLGEWVGYFIGIWFGGAVVSFFGLLIVYVVCFPDQELSILFRKLYLLSGPIIAAAAAFLPARAIDNYHHSDQEFRDAFERGRSLASQNMPRGKNFRWSDLWPTKVIYPQLEEERRRGWDSIKHPEIGIKCFVEIRKREGIETLFDLRDIQFWRPSNLETFRDSKLLGWLFARF
ncbi:MAG: hypothetical protein HZA89_10585 [Verrucomicrobia bacterium]|nr:hypothetical protein [Verrucomicrobiota bacterium]